MLQMKDVDELNGGRGLKPFREDKQKMQLYTSLTLQKYARSLWAISHSLGIRFFWR